MSVCTQCGHPLGVGRFCTNCGQPVDESGPVSEETFAADDWRTGTAERPAVSGPAEPTIEVGRPVLPPPVTTASEPPRYPLYADEAVPAPADDPLTSTDNHRHVGERQPRSAAVIWVPWIVGAAVAAPGRLGRESGCSWAAVTTPRRPRPTPPRATPVRPAPRRPTPRSRSPASKPTKDKPAKPGKPDDVARFATAKVPATGPPNEDVDGNMVRYEGRNMLDGVPETTWRMDRRRHRQDDHVRPRRADHDHRGRDDQRLRQDRERRRPEAQLVHREPAGARGGVGVRRRHHDQPGLPEHSQPPDRRGRQRHHRLGPGAPGVRVASRGRAPPPATTPRSARSHWSAPRPERCSAPSPRPDDASCSALRC